MAFELLSEVEQGIVHQCMVVICGGAFLDDAEFATRLGIDRGQLAKILSHWPALDDAQDDSATCVAINNCLNEICHGLDIPPAEWERWFNVPRSEIAAVYAKWTKLKGWPSTGIR